MESFEATGGVVSAEKKILTIDELLKFTKEQGASDLHLSEGSTPMIRIDGVMHKLDLPGLDRDGIRSLLISAMDNDQRKRFEEQYEIDFAKEIDDNTRFRCNIYKQIQGKAEEPSRQLKNVELGIAHNQGGHPGTFMCSMGAFGVPGR